MRFHDRNTLLRLGLLLMLTAGAFAASLYWGESPSEVAHLAVLPVFAAYVLIFRPDIRKRVRTYHIVYFTALTGLVAAYLGGLSRVSPDLRVRWTELPLAVYFLGSLHVVVWLIDRLINTALSTVFGLRAEARSPRRLYIPKTICRVLIVAALAGPYLLATFTIHWVKFADDTDPWQQSDMPFRQVQFDATDGVRLQGWFIPAAEASDATVIIAPGRELTKACFLPYAKAFRDNGYNVLLMDLRGTGGSMGHTYSFGIREAEDVRGAVRYLKDAHPRASRYLFGFGISHGAAAVISAASADDRIQAVVVADSTFAGADWSTKKLTASLPGPVGEYIRRATLLVASAQLGCALPETGTARAIARLSPRPVLIVHESTWGPNGESPNDPARSLYRAAREPKKLCRIAQLGSGQSALAAWETYLAQTLRMFDSVRASRPAFQ